MISGSAARFLVPAALVLAGLAVVMVQMDVPLLELLGGEPSAPTTARGVERLAKELSSGDSLRRLEVTRLIGMATGDGRPAAIEPLRRALKDRDNSVRSQAIRALGTMGDAARAAIPELVPLLQVWDPEVGHRAQELLKKLMDRPAAKAHLAELLEIAVTRPQGYAAPLIGTFAPEDVIPALLPLIRAGETDPRTRAIHLAARFEKRGAAAIPVLIEVLEANERSVSFAAGDALGHVASGEPAVSALAKALENTELDSVAAQALERIGPPAAAALPALKTQLTNQDGYARVCAARAIGVIGGDRAEATRFLIAEVDRKNWHALTAIGELGVATPEAVASLAKGLPVGSKIECGTSPYASQSLAKLGKAAASALVPLERALEHPCDWARMEAARAIHAIGGTGTSQWKEVLRRAASDPRLAEEVAKLTRAP